MAYLLFCTQQVFSQVKPEEISDYQSKFEEIFASEVADTIKLRFIINHVHDVSANQSELPSLYYKQGKILADAQDNKYWNGKLEIVLANLFKEMRDWDQAEIAYENALQYFEESQNEEELLNTKIELSLHYSLNRARDLALAQAYEAEEMAKGMGPKRQAEILMLFSKILVSFVKQDEGIEKALEARKIYEELNMQKELADNYEHTAIAHMREYRFYKALPDIDTAINIALRNPDWGYRRHFEYIQNRAQINGDSGNYKKALLDLKYVEDQTKGIDSLDFYFFNSHKIGTFTWRQRDLKRSKAVHLEIINRPDILYNRWAVDAYAYLSMIYEQEGKYDSAYYYHMKYHEIENQRNVHESSMQMENLKAYHETEEKELKIKDQEERIKQVRTIQLLSFGLAGILAILFFQSFRNSKRRSIVNEELEQANKLLDKKNKQNEVLLKEIHHRVKNNLQTVSSLLYLQSFNIEDEELKEKIKISQQRVESMALIHKNLYQKDNLSSIELQDYFNKLSENLINAYRSEKEIKILVEIEKYNLDVDIAVPLGLIVNELVTNSIKYAFPEKKEGIIKIAFEKQKDKHILKVSDNGIGKAEGVKENFGSQLISILTRQIDGTINTGNTNGHWTEITY